MQTIDVYDVSGDRWYQQASKNAPGARTRGCAVVGVASDKSSFNIYYYGGYDGLHPESSFYDDVWVLSLPSFTWTQINQGQAVHARAGHQCFTPYPDQMMVLGGYPPQPGTEPTCLDQGPIVNFNLSSGEWLEGYDPMRFAEYAVPSKVQSVIGGHAAGGATVTAPVASAWAKGLDRVFGTPYDEKKITHYWPYASATSSNRPSLPTGGGSNNGGSGGLPSWAGPVLGVILGLMGLIAIIILVVLYQRRKFFFRNRSGESGTEDTGLRILSWMRGQTTEKAATVVTSEGPISPEMEPRKPTPIVHAVYPPTTHHEMPDTNIAELHGKNS